MYLRPSNSLHSILTTVLCKKIKQHGLKFHASGQRSIRVEPYGMVQPITHNLVHQKQDGSDHTTLYMSATSIRPHGSANRSCNDVNKMAAPIRTSSQYYFCANSLKEYEIITLI